MTQPENREKLWPGFLQTIPLSRFKLAQGFTGSEQGTARTRAPLDQVLLVSGSWAAAATKVRQVPSPSSPPGTYSPCRTAAQLTEERTKETSGALHI